MRPDLNRYVSRFNSDKVLCCRPPASGRPLTARELELAADLEMARGNRQRAELLSWQAHDARCGVSA